MLQPGQVRGQSNTRSGSPFPETVTISELPVPLKPQSWGGAAAASTFSRRRATPDVSGNLPVHEK